VTADGVSGPPDPIRPWAVRVEPPTAPAVAPAEPPAAADPEGLEVGGVRPRRPWWRRRAVK
jgi:hypothetical protein